MPIEQVFEKREDAPEFLRGALLEDNGKFVFRAELPTETQGLKTGLQKEREAREAAERALKGFEGIDPQRARKLAEEAEKAEREGLKNKGDWETREKQLTERLAADLAKREQQFQAELDGAKARAERLQKSLEQHLVRAEATAALAAQGGLTDLLLPHVISQIRVLEDGENFVARVIGPDGNPRIADVKGTPMTIAQLVAEMRENTAYAPAFKAPRVGGSGAPGESTAGATGTVTISRADARDTNKYKAAREQAQKAGVELQILE